MYLVSNGNTKELLVPSKKNKEDKPLVPKGGSSAVLPTVPMRLSKTLPNKAVELFVPTVVVVPAPKPLINTLATSGSPNPRETLSSFEKRVISSLILSSATCGREL